MDHNDSVPTHDHVKLKVPRRFVIVFTDFILLCFYHVVHRKQHKWFVLLSRCFRACVHMIAHEPCGMSPLVPICNCDM